MLKKKKKNKRFHLRKCNPFLLRARRKVSNFGKSSKCLYFGIRSEEKKKILVLKSYSIRLKYFVLPLE